MKLKQKVQGNVSVLSLDGKIKGGIEIGEIHTAIKSSLEKNIKQIVIDLKEVSWMGSLGIGVLICCLTTVRNAGGELKLSGLSEKVKKILEITKLDHVFETHPGVDQAVASF